LEAVAVVFRVLFDDILSLKCIFNLIFSTIFINHFFDCIRWK
jgi:hypothetical protein